jgi:hypothetical protein
MEVDLAEYRLLHGEVIALTDALITALLTTLVNRLITSLMSAP